MRIALGIEYDGSNYHGWQKQEQVPSIQAAVENALSKVANHPVTVACAGRTDAGVHALEQVIHFDTDAKRELIAWVFGTNTYLPPDIRVQWAKEVPADFHARFSAIARQYRYVIYNHKTPSAIWRNYALWHQFPIDIDLMQTAANYLLGEHDFSAFRGSGCQSRSACRNVQFIEVSRDGEMIHIEVKANAFLLHMVRNIVGMLLEVGSGRRPPIWAQEVLLSRDRKQNADTAPAQGLFLVTAIYPHQFQNHPNI